MGLVCAPCSQGPVEAQTSQVIFRVTEETTFGWRWWWTCAQDTCATNSPCDVTQVIQPLLDLLIFTTEVSQVCLFKLQLSEQSEKKHYWAIEGGWVNPPHAKILSLKVMLGSCSHSWEMLDTVNVVPCRKTSVVAGENHTGYPSQLPSIPLQFLTWYCFNENRLLRSICRFPEWAQPRKSSPCPPSLQFHKLQGEKFAQVGLLW